MKENKYNHLPLFGLKFLTAILLIWVTTHNTVIAQNAVITIEPERKADYFERIYFCGLNKEGIVGRYRTSIQELDGKQLSPAALQQYELLIALEKNVVEASGACEALEIVGAAIYELDAATAIKQQVKQPTEKANGNLRTAVTSVVNRNTDSSSKTNRTNRQTNEVLNSVNEVTSALSFLHKDKPCKKIVTKIVEIGYHPTASEAAKIELKEINGKKYHTQSNITIKNINFKQLTEIKAQLKKNDGIVDVKSGEFKNNIVTLEIMHNLVVDDVVNLIVNQKKSYKIEVESTSGDDGVLVVGK